MPSEHLLHGLSDLADGAAISGTDDGQAKLKSIGRHQFLSPFFSPNGELLNQGILTEGECSVQLTSSFKVACFVKKENIILNLKNELI